MTSQIWLITGAGRGLGKALTEAALAAGHTVVATVRGDHRLAAHDRLRIRTLDVRDRAAAHRLVRQSVSELERLDVLVNNAGYGLIGAVEEVSQEEAREIVDTDLLGPLWLSQAVVPVMRAQGSGHIVQISTVGAVGTMATLGLYNAAKWGLEGFSEALAAEVAGFGIRVTLVEPGEIATEWATASMRFSDSLAAYDPLRVQLFGTAAVPWPAGEPGGGTSPQAVADEILAHVADPADSRRRLLIGDDAPAQVAAALDLRRRDYQRDPRFCAAESAGP